MTVRGRLRLFPFRKRSLPFLTVDAIFGNQAFSHGRCNMFKPKLNLRFKFGKGLGSPIVDVSVMKDS